MELPPSKKTRALLAYLSVTNRSHRRDRLCSLLWDVADDPRGALRWSLSKLRGLVNESDAEHIVATRDSVRFDQNGSYIDIFAIKKRLTQGVESISTDELEDLVKEFRGEFLEGLELSDFHDFQAWCVAEREQARSFHTKLLSTLVDRFQSQPEKALLHARTLAQVDPLNERARATLVRLLVRTGHRREAEQQYQAGSRLLAELGSESTGELREAWRELGERPPKTASPEEQTESPPPRAGTQPKRLIGRRVERAKLIAALDNAVAKRRESVLWVTGEPGLGKTRILTELAHAASDRGGTVLDGCAYEAETGRPYGPWIDALRRLPAVAVGKTIGSDLAPLLPELAHDETPENSRDRLFGAVVELVASRAHSAPPVLLVFDDIHWLDEASASLLHYVVRMNRHRPVVVALAARDGELPDNEPVQSVIRSLRRERILEEISLEPLSQDETAELVREVAPNVDPKPIVEESAGNPLFALEVARSLPHRQDDPPQTLTELVRDRFDRLPPEAGDVLRWGAVLGHTFSVRRLDELTTLDLDGLVSALEVLERHALIRAEQSSIETEDGYIFTHEVVRRAVYAEISEPRRRLMHLRIAQALVALEGADESVVAEIAHHAAIAGEAAVAARACVSAGRRCLRLFANTEAESLARRGMRYAEKLRDPDRIKLLLELTQISLAAKRPPNPEDAAKTIEDLAEQALDHGCLEHARLGFTILSYLRWERGDWSDARRQTLRAELVSRSGDEKEHVVAMAEAARCLAIIERDLPQAEALALEAGARSARLGIESATIVDAQGMLRLHRGELDEASRLFQHARTLSCRDGDRLGEFQALEHLITLELDRKRYDNACALSTELVKIGEKFREGSEAPFARALSALSAYARGDDEALGNLDEAFDELRAADAKHRLAYALTRAAHVDLLHGDAVRARTRATEAHRAASSLGRPSEIAMARITLTRVAQQLKDKEGFKRHIAELRIDALDGVSAYVREAVGDLLEKEAVRETTVRETNRDGTRHRREIIR
jgi:DNA-binding SARP family transcriptional activator/tetratricopeptide (TPR) repeat protein